MENHPLRIAIIGAGWAGCTAALLLARAGHKVTLYEAAKTAGGRARRIEKEARIFDNGQHILLGAYRNTLSLIDSLHANSAPIIRRLPLSLISAPNTPTALRLITPQLPAPIHLLAALFCARGLSGREKLYAMAWAARYLEPLTRQKQRRSISAEQTVAALIALQPERVRTLLWEPLCIAALNTPVETASARVFIEVLRQTFTGSRNDSDLIIPKVDLSALLPDPALAEIQRLGGQVLLGHVVHSVQCASGHMQVHLQNHSIDYDCVTIATAPQHVPRLLEQLPQAKALCERLTTLNYETITTLHFEFTLSNEHAQLSDGDMRLLDGSPGQWLFWHQQIDNCWRASVVISAHHKNDQSTHTLYDATLKQLQHSYHLPQPDWQQTVSERRATYACTPESYAILMQQQTQLLDGGLHFAGDWCAPELPATLETAVLSGIRSAQTIIHRYATPSRFSK